MAKSRRKDPSDHINSTLLLEILGHLSKVSYFDITVHKEEDYSLLEDYFEVELQANPEHLRRYSRVMECTLLLDNTEYQSLVFQLCSNEKIARNTRQYIHSFDVNGGELCIINLYRDLRVQLKNPGKKRGVIKNPKTTPVTQEFTDIVAPNKNTQEARLTPEKIAQKLDKDLIRLEKQLKKALETEDYRLAAKIQSEIAKIKAG